MPVTRRIKATVSEAVIPDVKIMNKTVPEGVTPGYRFFLESHVKDDLMPLSRMESPLIIAIKVRMGEDGKTFLTEIVFPSKGAYQTYENCYLGDIRDKIAAIFKDSPDKPVYAFATLEPDSPAEEVKKFDDLLQNFGAHHVIFDTGYTTTTEKLDTVGVFSSSPASSSQEAALPPSPQPVLDSAESSVPYVTILPPI